MLSGRYRLGVGGRQWCRDDDSDQADRREFHLLLLRQVVPRVLWTDPATGQGLRQNSEESPQLYEKHFPKIAVSQMMTG